MRKPLLRVLYTLGEVPGRAVDPERRAHNAGVECVILRHNLHTADKLKGVGISRWKLTPFGLCVIKGIHKMKIS